MSIPDHYGGRVFLLTGATGGIGAAVMRALVQHDAYVIASGRDAKLLAKLVSDLNRAGEKVLPVPADLCAQGSAQLLIRAAMQWKGALNGLILCAGGARFHYFQRLTKAEFDAALELNLLANVDLVREAVPHLTAWPTSAIVFINSIASREPASPRGTAYLSAKAGLRFFADALFSEVRDLGIHVSSILPDLTDTAMIPDMLNYDRSTLISPTSVARAVLFVLTVGRDACVTELHIRPQSSVRSLTSA